MQKATLDKYIKHSVAQQKELQLQIENQVSEILTENSEIIIDDLLASLNSTSESSEMIQLRKEAEQLGDESNKLFGVRSDGYFNLNHDFIGLGWLRSN